MRFTGEFSNGKHVIVVDGQNHSVSETCLRALIELGLSELEPTQISVSLTPQMAHSIKAQLGKEVLAGYRDRWTLRGDWTIECDTEFCPVVEAVLPGQRTRKLWQKNRGTSSTLTAIHDWIRDRGQLTQWFVTGIVGIGFLIATFAQLPERKVRGPDVPEQITKPVEPSDGEPVEQPPIEARL
ncbi:MAG: hypothetical protein R3C18_27835 [Planctomycetaceae bacterium]